MFDTLIDARELHERCREPGLVIVDCRHDLADPGAGHRAYLAAHIPRAIHAHLDKDLSGPPRIDHGRHPLPSPRRMEELFGSFGIGTGTQVVAYDDSSGGMASRLWWMLRYMGHQAVAVLDGGLSSWRNAGFEIETQERRNAPAVFRGRPEDKWLITTGQVPQVPLLIDSREPVRFRGEQEPIDPVAGHIPGARNYFWKENIGVHGQMRTPAEIRRQLGKLYGECPPGEAVFYCGSGVTACANILAAVHAGMPFPGLYAGSWSEWCSDPARPVATGEG